MLSSVTPRRKSQWEVRHVTGRGRSSRQEPTVKPSMERFIWARRLRSKLARRAAWWWYCGENERDTAMTDLRHLGVSFIFTRTAVLVLMVLTTACSSSTPEPVQGQAPELWGDLKPVVSVKELMADMLDPLADNIFDAVGIEATLEGVVETKPTTDEDWEKIRTGAVTMAEGAYLLKIPRPFAPPGDLNNSTGPDAVELSPDEIRAKVESDLVEWNARIEALRNVGLEVLDIVERRDVEELWDAGANLDEACENCHRSYWYPREDATFYEKLNQRVQSLALPPESEEAARP